MASGTFESSFLTSMLAAFVPLAVIRMLSEMTTHTTMTKRRFKMKELLLKMQAIRFPRRLWQYMLETLWVVGTGALVGPLAC